jgi:hypothetical protein
MELNLNSLSIISIALGITLLVLGRRIFWLLVGAIGFVAGVVIFEKFFPEQTGWTPLVAALLMGLAGAGLAIFLQKTAVWVIGFLAGIFISIVLINLFGIDLGNLTWLLWMIGGAIGAALTAMLFNGALIILSSLSGAVMILNALGTEQPLTTGLLAVLVIIGIIIQSRHKNKV